jgi:hypothetical protein
MATKLTPVDVIKPVAPGVSWTAPPKGRPWTTPPKFVKVSDIAQGYINNLSSPSMINSMLDAIETGVPLAALAESLMLSGVHKGVHTTDAGILVMPVIVEMLKTAAELHGVEYIVFPDDNEQANTVPDRVIREAIKDASMKKEETAVEPKVELSGLMARKSKMENM